MKMRTIWEIRAAVRNQDYDLPDSVSKTPYRRYYTPDQDSYLPYRGCLMDWHTKLSQVPVSHHDFPDLH